MGKKLILNVTYTVGLFIAAVTAYWGFEHKQYTYVVGGILIVLLFLYLKAQLLKELRGRDR